MELFKPVPSEEDIRMNRILNSYSENDSSNSANPKIMQRNQFKLYVENLINLKEEDTLFYLKKIYLDDHFQNDFPDDYFSIFAQYNLFNLLIDIMCNSPDINCQIYSILILSNASLYRKTAFYGFPYIIDKDLFIRFMMAPLYQYSDSELARPFVPLYYSNLLHNTFSYSEELARAFYESGFYTMFIDMCLSLDKEKHQYVSCWIDLIISLSSSSFPIPDDEKFLLIQVIQILFDQKYYIEYLRAVDSLIDSSSDNLIQNINSSPTYDQLIRILIDFKSEQTPNMIKYRKICIHALYKMILRDECKICNLSMLPIDILAEVLKYDNISDQVCVLQLLSICLKKEDNLNFSLISDFINYGIYNKLMDHSIDFTFESKYAMSEFFIVSLIKANPDQLEILFEYQLFTPVLSNIDSSNADLMMLLSYLLEKLLSKDDFIINYLLPYHEIFFQIANENNDENSKIIFHVCDVLSKFLKIE